MKNYITKLHYSKNTNTIDKCVLLMLCAFTPIYRFIVLIRIFLYKKNILKSTKLNAYTISIGNITTGGTGKTPITIEIANYINNIANKKVAVLSRGYGGQLSSKGVNVVSNGKSILLTPYLAGDEPFLIAQNLSNVPVITGKNRLLTGQHAIDVFNSEILILDDGFQHLRIKRDLNLLIVDGEKQFGNEKILPAGPLREDLNQIKRADKIIVVNKNPFNEALAAKCDETAIDLSQKYQKPVFCCNFINDGFFNILTSEKIDLNNKNIYAFAGIAQPKAFFDNFKKQNVNIVKLRAFTDHHMYTKSDLDNIIREAQALNTDYIITTEKDAVKLSALLDKTYKNIPLCFLKLKLDLNVKELIGL